jgi:hypothetical protein
MTEERTEEFSEPRLNIRLAVADDKRSTDTTRSGSDSTHSADATPNGATAPRKDSPGDQEKGAKEKVVSAAKLRMQSRLPALDDDADVGVEKEHIVTRDGKADLLFTGALLASAAPDSAPKGTWQEYRIYKTHREKYVFAKVTRNVFEQQPDAYEADVFDPTPSSVPSQMIRTAREIARARPLTWMDAAVAFFGYDPLAKALYRKLSVRFEEQIS